MLIGEYVHTLDPKKRVSLPSKFRKELGETIIITRGLDNCLFIYSLTEWGKISEKLAGLPFGASDSRSFNRFMLSGAVETDVDSAGRILIPEYLRNFAGLSSRVVLAGIHNRVEVWDEKKWQDYTAVVERKADQFAEKLGEIGML